MIALRFPRLAHRRPGLRVAAPALLLVAVAACAPRPLGTPTAAHAGHATYRVDGRHLRDWCGEEVVLRGINHMNVVSDRTGASFPEIARTGANTVRIMWMMFAPPEGMDAPIRSAIANGMIPMIELHDATGKLERVPALVEYWTRPASLEVLRRYERDLLVNIANEAGNGSETDSSFVAVYSDAIRRMRAAGIRSPLVIDAGRWGRDGEQILRLAPALTSADPDRNVLYSVHWWDSDNDTARVTRVLEESVRRDIPLIVGEFAHKETGCKGRIPYEHIMKESQRLRIGWMAWSWGPGNSDCAEMDMTTDSRFGTLNGWGLETAVTDPNSIRNTSRRPHSIVHGRCQA